MRDIKPEMADFLPMEESEMKRDQQTGEYLCDGCGTPLVYDKQEQWWHCPKCEVNFKIVQKQPTYGDFEIRKNWQGDEMNGEPYVVGFSLRPK